MNLIQTLHRPASTMTVDANSQFNQAMVVTKVSNVANSFGTTVNIQDNSQAPMYDNLEPVTHDQYNFKCSNTPISMYEDPDYANKVIDQTIEQALAHAHVQVESDDGNSKVSQIEMHIASIGEKSLDKMFRRNIHRDLGTDEDKKARDNERKLIRKAYYEQTTIKPGFSSSPLYQALYNDISNKVNPNDIEYSVIEGKLNERINHMIQTERTSMQIQLKTTDDIDSKIQTDRTRMLSQLKTTDEIDSIITDLEKKYYSVK
ncbi:hypothetical protein [Vibrio tetraodonis]|uniref:hypothetical protein n=1 Tax=Vibrio tetraodonis TaxID=2231647 RepID=UPI000E0A6D4F|nr:hypothetical protein [Vibrio tetraodonis]